MKRRPRREPVAWSNPVDEPRPEDHDPGVAPDRTLVRTAPGQSQQDLGHAVADPGGRRRPGTTTSETTATTSEIRTVIQRIW
jgi:hypothetical protein